LLAGSFDLLGSEAETFAFCAASSFFLGAAFFAGAGLFFLGSKLSSNPTSSIPAFPLFYFALAFISARIFALSCSLSSFAFAAAANFWSSSARSRRSCFG